MKYTANDLRGKKIGFFGMGESNISLLRTLPLESCEIILRSDTIIKRNELPKALSGCKIYDGSNSLSNITEDIIFLSPSVRRDRCELKDAAKRGVQFSSDAELFYENNNAPIYAVTGSDGKSTTATLTSSLLNKRIPTKLIGNVGTPMLESIDPRCDAYVTELSSFMLTYCVPHTKRACLTNLTPNHLDWHKSEDEYREAKLSLLRSADEAVIPYDEEILQALGRRDIFALTSTAVSYSELRTKIEADLYVTFENDSICRNGKKLIDKGQILRAEPYNIKNLMSAIAMAHDNVSDADIRFLAESFTGLPHRCELVGHHQGIDFYDSSIDSTPSRTGETLRALGKRCVLILGGRSKGVSYLDLLPELHFVECAVITGENSSEIYKAIKEHTHTVVVDDFDEAVEFASRLAEGCGTVLLSPASTSYDRFSNYKERGEHFKCAVKKYRS